MDIKQQLEMQRLYDGLIRRTEKAGRAKPEKQNVSSEVIPVSDAPDSEAGKESQEHTRKPRRSSRVKSDE